GRAGADETYAFAGEVHPFVRPLPGVVPAALEAIEAGEGGDVRGGEAAYGGDEELGGEPLALVGDDVPAVGLGIVARRRDACAEADVALQVEPVGDEIEVAADLGVPRIALRPFPFRVQGLREGVAVGVALRVAARPWIAVPVPGAADAARRLQHQGREAQPVAQGVELVEAGEARADDQRIVRLRRRGRLCGALPGATFLGHATSPRVSRGPARGPTMRWDAACRGQRPCASAAGATLGPDGGSSGGRQSRV